MENLKLNETPIRTAKNFKINNIKLKANKTKQIDLVDYAKFVLNNGSIEEKREFMSIFKDKFIMKDKKIGLL